MWISRLGNVRFVSVSLLLMALFSALGPLGHAQPPVMAGPGLQSDSLAFTINPDKSVGVGWNTVTNLTSGTVMPLTGGYRIHASSNFTQQSNAVVENTTIQYQLPPAFTSYVTSISLTATQNGLTGTGALAITTGLPLQSLNIGYVTSPTKIQVNATAQLQLGCSLCAAFGGPFTNQSTFKQLWMKTFANSSWINTIKYQIQNSTMRALSVTDIRGTETDSLYQANVAIGFVAVPTGPTGTDWVTAFENVLFRGSTPPSLDAVIRSAMTLSTGETANLTYNASTGQIVIKINSSFVSNLDSQLNTIKNQFFQVLHNLGAPTTPGMRFVNATTVTISKISATSDYDLNAGKATSSFNGLLLNPPTEGPNSNFTIHGLFQTLGSIPMATGVNITLAGGSDNTYQVKIIVPTGTRQADSTTSNSATWYNVQNATVLQNVEFQLQRLPTSIFAFLTSPTGIAIEALVAAAIIATILVLARRRRAAMPMPVTPSGPTTTPGLGPGPGPPAPSQ